MSAMAEMTVGKHRVKCKHACVLQTMGCCLPWGVSVACFIALERSCSIRLSRGKGLLFWVRIFPQQHLEVPSLKSKPNGLFFLSWLQLKKGGLCLYFAP